MERAEGGGFPEIPNGTYEFEVKETVSPYDDDYNPGKQKFHVDFWVLNDGQVVETDWLRKYVNITEGMLNGHVHPKTAYYEILEACGYNMDGPLPSIRTAIADLPGKRGQIVVKNGPPQNDPNGEVRPRIVTLMATPQRRRKEPVAAGARRGATATFEDDE
jgi:hypothetical protein